MKRQNKFNDLVRFSGVMEAELLTMLLLDSNVTFKLTNLSPRKESRTGRSPPSPPPVVVQVLIEDLSRAKALLAEYRKTQGVPFS